MRRNFAQILKEGKVDIKREYERLYTLFYKENVHGLTLYHRVKTNFLMWPFRGTCRTLNDFDESCGFCFEEQPENFNIEYLVTFCEYVWNLMGCCETLDTDVYEQIHRVIEKIGYMKSEENGLTIFVEKSPAAIAVAESPLVPQNLSYKVISYNHHSMKGDLVGKRQMIHALADILEPKRDELKNADKSLADDLFFLFNNVNVRHNNVEPGKIYKKYVAEMSSEELENWYDEIYQMCLLAFLQMENTDRKSKVNELKAQISNG